MMANMTLLDTSRNLATPQPRNAETSLLDDLNQGTRYAIAFGGQGGPWLDSLTHIVRRFGAERELAKLVQQSDELLAPLTSELAKVPHAFDVLTWVDAGALDESIENVDAPPVPTATELLAPAYSIPGITLTQLLGLSALERQGLDVRRHRPAAVIGHSQGALAVEVVQGIPAIEVLTIARLIGIAAQIVGARRNLLGRAMISVSNVNPAHVIELLSSIDVHANLRNGRRTIVVSGREADIARAVSVLEAAAESDRQLRDRKTTGGAGFAPVIEHVEAGLAFHHPDLSETTALVSEWAQKIGFDGAHAAALTQRAIIDPLDWVASVNQALDAGVEWVLDLGPNDLASRLVAAETRPRGVGVVTTTTSEGHRNLTKVGARPARTQAWAHYAPRAVTLPDGSQRVETKFTRLTGKSPVLLAGMTPTTVDSAIVAAAANAGFWAELAGGGQVTEEIFTERMREIGGLLDEGATFQFNALFLDPYLWKLHLGGKRLVQKARSAGSPIDGVIVTAGIPELDEAVSLVSELRDLGITHTVFKPGTVQQIRQVLAIADTVAKTDPNVSIIIQIEGGKAGGHRSWEDLDELLISTYADLRQRENLVVCVGGGIGTPKIAAEYLTGAWARQHGQPDMPLDGVLVGTAAMATIEATTSPQVKDLLVATQGSDTWVGAGQAVNNMASARSQLGADLHEIDNAFSRTGRLLDEVAGDADAVQSRHDEIVEALNRTAKPWFGDLATMTYGQLLDRFVELSGLPQSLTSKTGRWPLRNWKLGSRTSTN